MIVVLLLAGATAMEAAGVLAGQPDTGQDTCYDGAAMVACTAANSGVAAPYPGQDGRFGRDAKATAGMLVKQGGGAAGLDYTKVANSGTDVAAGTPLGAGASDWACTRDNVTGLVWEVKVNDVNHLRHYAWVYSWYSTDAATNGGNPGTAVNPGAVCAPTKTCNTQAFVADVNATALCGFTDWRMPSLRELQSIVDHGTFSPALEPTYFPNSTTPGYDYWTGTTQAGGTYAAWVYSFGLPSNDGALSFNKDGGSHIRLVRGVPF